MSKLILVALILFGAGCNEAKRLNERWTMFYFPDGLSKKEQISATIATQGKLDGSIKKFKSDTGQFSTFQECQAYALRTAEQLRGLASKNDYVVCINNCVDSPWSNATGCKDGKVQDFTFEE